MSILLTKLLLLLVGIVVYPRNVASQDCLEPTFNYTTMFTKVGQEEHTISIKDCVQPGQFPYTITELRGYQPVKHLRKGAFSDMLFLARITLTRNCIETLSPGAFRRLPKLNAINLDHNRLEKIPVGVFNNLKVLMLQLEHNNIGTIENLAFANMSRLEQIDLSGNRLEFWSSTWFKGSDELNAVYLAHNRIRTVPSRAFEGLSKLLLVSFRQNQISQIEPNAFEGLSILETLDLSRNQLLTIQSDVFPDDISIETLYLSHNKLGFLSSSLLSKLSLDYIYREGNPWQCPCMERINAWIQKNHVTLAMEKKNGFENNPVCVFKTRNTNECNDEVDEESITLYFNSIDPVKPIQRPIQEDICN